MSERAKWVDTRTDQEFIKAMLSWTERRSQTNMRRLRERREWEAIATEAAAEEARAREKRKRKRWTEKRPGQLRAIRDRLKAGDASQLSVKARRMLVLIARRPDVVTSRKWTTAKVARVTVNADLVHSHFHHWAASVARAAATFKQRQAAERAAAELKRQDELAYKSLEAAHRREERAAQKRDERLWAKGHRPAVDSSALARLVDRSTALREDARLDALQRKELDACVPEGPWIALDDVEERPRLEVLKGGAPSA